MKVAGIVPAWSRGAELAALLRSVAAQTRPVDVLIVVDNDASDEARAAYAGFGADVVALGENLGAVAGFREGMRRAWSLGADAVWLLDDDSTAAPDVLARLLDALGADVGVGGAAPAVRFPDGRAYAGWRWGAATARGFGHEPVEGADGVVAIDWAPFAGLLLTRAACRAAGELRRDFFLWHADVEYCLRARAAGVALVGVPAAVVDHPIYAPRARRVLGREFVVRAASPWQEYEDARNWARLAHELRGTPLADGTPWRRRVLGEAARSVAVIAADPAGVARVRMRLLGLADGWRGRGRARVPGAPAAAQATYALSVAAGSAAPR